MNITKYTYLVSGIPQNYLIDRDGVIIGEDVIGNDLKKTLTRLFERN